MDPQGTYGPISIARLDPDGNVTISCADRPELAASFFGIPDSVVQSAKRAARERRELMSRKREEAKRMAPVPHKLTARVATFFVEYLDPPNYGFLSNAPPDAQSTAGGNPGEDLGAQRRIAFEQALSRYTSVLTSDIPINVSAIFSDTLPCSSGSAVLGRCGTSFFTYNNIWYGNALRNRLRGADLSSTSYDITALFNPNIGNATCLTSSSFYYAGYASSVPSGRSDFFTTSLHEVIVLLCDGHDLS